MKRIIIGSAAVAATAVLTFLIVRKVRTDKSQNPIQNDPVINMK